MIMLNTADVTQNYVHTEPFINTNPISTSWDSILNQDNLYLKDKIDMLITILALPNLVHELQMEVTTKLRELIRKF